MDEGRAACEVREDESVDTLIEVVVGTWYSLFLSWVRIDGFPLRERAASVSSFLARVLSAQTG